MTARDWIRRNGSRAGFSALTLIAGYNAAAAHHLSQQADRRVQHDLAAQARTAPARPATCPTSQAGPIYQARPTSQAGPTDEVRQRQAGATKAQEVDKQQTDNLRDIAEKYAEEREPRRRPRPRPPRRSGR